MRAGKRKYSWGNGEGESEAPKVVGKRMMAKKGRRLRKGSKEKSAGRGAPVRQMEGVHDALGEEMYLPLEPIKKASTFIGFPTRERLKTLRAGDRDTGLGCGKEAYPR